MTGHYRESQGDGAVKSCSFSFKGEARDNVASIIILGEKQFNGEIKPGTEAVNLTIEKGREISGCGVVLMPEIATGLSLDLLNKVPWIELKLISNDKAYFYSEPKENKQLKSYLVKGDVVGVVATQNDWLHVDYYSNSGKTIRRWIKNRETASF